MREQHVTLNEAETADLRKCVSTAHHRRVFKGGVTWVLYVGGPLDGIQTPIEPADAGSSVIGWCYPRDSGLVQIHYVQSGEPGVIQFRDCVTIW